MIGIVLFISFCRVPTESGRDFMLQRRASKDVTRHDSVESKKSPTSAEVRQAESLVNF